MLYVSDTRRLRARQFSETSGSGGAAPAGGQWREMGVLHPGRLACSPRVAMDPASRDIVVVAPLEAQGAARAGVLAVAFPGDTGDWTNVAALPDIPYDLSLAADVCASNRNIFVAATNASGFCTLFHYSTGEGVSF